MGRCEVQLDKPYYSPGDTINGSVFCYFKSKNKVTDIHVKFKGNAEVRWKDGHEVHSNSELYFEMESDLISCERTFQSGEYSFPFAFDLPVDIPSSVNEMNCNIKYQIKATVAKPWALDYTARKEVFVYSYTNLNLNLSLKNPAVFIEEQFFPFIHEKIEVVMKLPKTGYIPDEMLCFTCSVKNKSSMEVEYVLINFVKVYQLIGRKTTKQKLVSTVGETYGIIEGTVPIYSKRTWNCQMRICNKIYNGNIDHCRIINAFWRIRIEVCLPALVPNIKMEVPITIGSIPFY